MWFGVAPETPPHIKRRGDGRFRLPPRQPNHESVAFGAGGSVAALSPRRALPPTSVSSPTGTDIEAKSPRGRVASPRKASVDRTDTAKDQSASGSGLPTGRRRIRSIPQVRQSHGNKSELQPLHQLKSEHEVKHAEPEQTTDWTDKDSESRREVVGNQSSANRAQDADTVVRESVGHTISSPRAEILDKLAPSSLFVSEGAPCIPAPASSLSSPSVCSTSDAGHDAPRLRFLRSRRGSRRGSRRFNMAEVSTESVSVTHAVRRPERLAHPATASIHPRNLVGHASSVCALATTDDHVVVSCSRDGLVKVWSRRTLTCLQTLGGHDDNVSCIDISSHWLVSGSHDMTLRLYRGYSGEDGPTFALHCVLRGHSGHVTKVQLPAPLPDHVLSCSDDATVRLWNAELSQCVRVLRGHTSRVTCVVVHQLAGQDCVCVCAGAAGGAISLWELQHDGANQDLDDDDDDDPSEAQPERYRLCRPHKATVQCVVVVDTSDPTASECSPSVTATLVVSCSNDGTIQLFNLVTFEPIAQLHDAKSPVYMMARTRHGGFVCSTRDGRLLVYNKISGHSHQPRPPDVELDIASTWLSSLDVRGDMVACCGEDMLFVVNIAKPEIHKIIETRHGFINCLRWVHPRAVMTCGHDNVIRLWTLS